MPCRGHAHGRPALGVAPPRADAAPRSRRTGPGSARRRASAPARSGQLAAPVGILLGGPGHVDLVEHAEHVLELHHQHLGLACAPDRRAPRASTPASSPGWPRDRARCPPEAAPRAAARAAGGRGLVHAPGPAAGAPPRFGYRPSSRRTCRSRPAQNPASVGRSWVLAATSAAAGYSPGALKSPSCAALEVQQAVGQHAVVVHGLRASRRARCPDPRRSPCTGCAGFPARGCPAGRAADSARTRPAHSACPRGSSTTASAPSRDRRAARRRGACWPAASR